MSSVPPKWPSRLLPRTLRARLLLILGAGLLLAHALSFSVLSYERMDATRSMMLRNLFEDIPVSVALLERLSPAQRVEWIPRLERRTYRYLLRPAQTGKPLASERARQVAGLIDDALAHRYALRPRAVSSLPERYEVELTLRDGRPLTIEVTPAPMPVARWLPWILIAQVVLLLACVGAAVRLATRPLAQLALAAERMDPAGKGAPLPQDGGAEIAKAAQALNTLQSRVAAHVSERTQILAAISHDLQTPITRMRLRVEALDESTEQARLLNDVDQISQLIREGLNYARSARVTMDPSVRLDLHAFLDSVVGDYQDTGKAVQHTGGDNASLQTHPQVLRRVLQNLIDNALAYAGSAETRLRVDGKGQVCIDVLDRGPGVPEAQLDAIKQPFHRLEPSRSRSTGGTGLGLAIAHQLTNALGGQLALINRDGGGLQATLTLGTKA
ncbi:HAMP domain-containing sensor histidine kinase [Marilutibacter chinensis]|uniref:histidine kinase n=1 Tax=Marilutibacter chinensis TaxID=2912247 RepID=A0ABS9I035_9GAMM|nr:HAMP domain-containing sensor histidine kinase [Lysobacter chinensis]MCF7223528.1 HAMP domain-containing histidine kinase [Lysobacter chinensis]MCF7223744.1 HAMP domain-containing histidine kinase [Lysobacter chinensis]